MPLNHDTILPSSRLPQPGDVHDQNERVNVPIVGALSAPPPVATITLPATFVEIEPERQCVPTSVRRFALLDVNSGKFCDRWGRPTDNPTSVKLWSRRYDAKRRQVWFDGPLRRVNIVELACMLVVVG